MLPGHTPFLSTLGLGEITYRRGTEKGHLTCFWGFAEVLPDRVNLLAEIGERAEDIDAGRADAVRDTRTIFQDTMKPRFIEVVESALGRKVVAFMSQVCFDPDMSAEIFVLEPEGDDSAPETES